MSVDRIDCRIEHRLWYGGPLRLKGRGEKHRSDKQTGQRMHKGWMTVGDTSRLGRTV